MPDSHATGSRAATDTLDMGEDIYHALASHRTKNKAALAEALLLALADWRADRQRLRELREAVEECNQKAEKLGHDGFVRVYQLETGPWHRLLGKARAR